MLADCFQAVAQENETKEGTNGQKKGEINKDQDTPEKAIAHKEPVEETDKKTKNEDSAKAEGGNMKADEVNSTAIEHLQHVNIEGCAIDIKKVCIMVCMLLITNDLYLFMYYHICYESLKP